MRVRERISQRAQLPNEKKKEKKIKEVTFSPAFSCDICDNFFAYLRLQINWLCFKSVSE